MRFALYVIFNEIVETVAFALEKEQLEFALRGVVGGSLVAIFIGESDIKLLAVVLLLGSLWVKKENRRRKDTL
jgi:hypothetical protein